MIHMNCFTNHLYSATISRSSSRTLNTILKTLPAKYYLAYCSADVVAMNTNATTPKAKSLGSVELYFSCNATLANALRKWMQRRFGAKSKFSRTVVPVQFCSPATFRGLEGEMSLNAILKDASMLLNPTPTLPPLTELIQRLDERNA